MGPSDSTSLAAAAKSNVCPFAADIDVVIKDNAACKTDDAGVQTTQVHASDGSFVQTHLNTAHARWPLLYPQNEGQVRQALLSTKDTKP